VQVGLLGGKKVKEKQKQKQKKVMGGDLTSGYTSKRENKKSKESNARFWIPSRIRILFKVRRTTLEYI
jgi:hypothetical protein